MHELNAQTCSNKQNCAVFISYQLSFQLIELMMFSTLEDVVFKSQ